MQVTVVGFEVWPCPVSSKTSPAVLLVAGRDDQNAQLLDKYGREQERMSAQLSVIYDRKGASAKILPLLSSNGTCL